MSETYCYDIICSFNAEVLSSPLKDFVQSIDETMEMFGAPVQGMHLRAEHVKFINMNCTKQLTNDDQKEIKSRIEEVFKDSDNNWGLVVESFVLSGIQYGKCL